MIGKSWHDTKMALLDLILRASKAGRGRLDSDEWEKEDDKVFVEEFERIIRNYEGGFVIKPRE